MSRSDPASEFTLPDSLAELIAVEASLRARMLDLHDQHMKDIQRLPRGVQPMLRPTFYPLLVAHRRWQHAYEKLAELRTAVE